MPTDGDPAIVGRCVRLLKEPSDTFCIELTVGAVTRDDVDEARLLTEEDWEELDLSLATR